jgi:hypothetical protein
MSFSRPIQWHHFHAEPIWPDGIFKSSNRKSAYLFQSFNSKSANFYQRTVDDTPILIVRSLLGHFMAKSAADLFSEIIFLVQILIKHFTPSFFSRKIKILQICGSCQSPPKKKLGPQIANWK